MTILTGASTNGPEITSSAHAWRLPALVSVSYWSFICLVHAVWLKTWAEIGTPPRYGCPKSWQVGFLARHHGIFDVGILWFFALFYTAPVWALWGPLAIINIWFRQSGASIGPRILRTFLW